MYVIAALPSAPTSRSPIYFHVVNISPIAPTYPIICTQKHQIVHVLHFYINEPNTKT